MADINQKIRWAAGIHFVSLVLVVLFSLITGERYWADDYWFVVVMNNVVVICLVLCFAMTIYGANVISRGRIAGVKVKGKPYFLFNLSVLVGVGVLVWSLVVSHYSPLYPRGRGFKITVNMVVRELGLPSDWRVEALGDWVRENSVGFEYADEMVGYAKRWESSGFVLLRVDEDFVYYRHLGENGIDEGGLRDDYDFTLDLKGLREIAGKGW